MQSYTVKYLTYFLFGAISGYLLSTFTNTTNDIEHINKELVATPLNKPAIAYDNNQMTKAPTKKGIAEESATQKIQMNSTPFINLPSDKQLSEKIIKLEAENEKITQKYHDTFFRLMSVTAQKESLDESDVTDQQMMNLKDDDFSEFRREQLGKNRDELYEFHQQDEDLNWGYQMNTQLSDFIQTHYNSNLVALKGVTCKVDTCELLIAELESGSWRTIMTDMRAQPWWQFSSTQSSSRSGEDEFNLFYLYLSN